MNLTAERLRELLDYDPETGVLTWKVSHTRAGTRHSHGYTTVSIDGRRYFAHRLAWVFVTGAWPAHHIDHRNGDKADCRFVNLREATRAQNMRNVGITRRNTSGFKGTYKHRRRWRAFISAARSRTYLGTFDTAEEAHAAYCEAAEKYHGEFHRKA
jgi:hypothetical protein